MACIIVTSCSVAFSASRQVGYVATLTMRWNQSSFPKNKVTSHHTLTFD